MNDRFALRILQAGAVAIVVATSTWNAFELDRFFVPKELVLHLTAVLAGFAALRLFREATVTRVDLMLAGFLLLSAVSAVLATNRWLALRALAMSVSGAIVFWTARRLRATGLDRPLLGALAIAVVAAAMTSLLQAYGVEITLFSESRAPGGTLGNRNFVAHVAAFGTPLLLLAALRARASRTFIVCSLGVMLDVASLVLTRSRAAWLAFTVVIIIFVLAMFLSSPLRRDGRIWRRLGGIVVMVVAGVAAALLIPNALRWRSDNPYLESVKRVADYQEGSGRGRLIQYQRSMLMALRHPLFGAGPGNWSVEYPANAARNDPSLNHSEPGTTFNPWPSSDWVAWLAERGFPAFALLVLTFIGIGTGALRQLTAAADGESALMPVALIATLIGAVIAGMFDAVLLLAVPTLIVWAALGALGSVPPSAEAGGSARFTIVIIVLMIVAAIGAFRSTAELTAMTLATDGDRMSLSRAGTIDPGNYRVHLRLARTGGRQRCEHARAARDLFPHAQAAIEVARRCD